MNTVFFYETLLWSRVSTAFVVLTPHCGAKFVQCETERCLLVAAACCLLDAWQQTANQKLSSEAHVTSVTGNEHCVNCSRWEEISKDRNTFEEIFIYFAPWFLSYFCPFVLAFVHLMRPFTKTRLKRYKLAAFSFFPKRSVACAPMASAWLALFMKEQKFQQRINRFPALNRLQ